MLRELGQVKKSQVTGGDCYCCCYREPYIEMYEGVWIGMEPEIKSCAKKCTSDSAIYAGFMHCREDTLTCSPLTNRELAAKIAYHRRIYGQALPEIDLTVLRGGSANAH